jgi:hypothetical protein
MLILKSVNDYFKEAIMKVPPNKAQCVTNLQFTYNYNLPSICHEQMQQLLCPIDEYCSAQVTKKFSFVMCLICLAILFAYMFYSIFWTFIK